MTAGRVPELELGLLHWSKDVILFLIPAVKMIGQVVIHWIVL